MFLSCSSDWGHGVPYSTSDQRSAAVALMAHSSRSFDRRLLSHWRFSAALSRSVPRPVVPDVLALPRGAVDGADDFPCCLAGTMGFPFTPGYPQIEADPSGLLLWWRSPCARATGGSLHTGVIFSAFSRWYLRQCALQRSVLADRLPPKLPTVGRLFVLPKALLSFSNLKCSRKYQITKSPNDALVSSRNLRLIVYFSTSVMSGVPCVGFPTGGL